MSEHMDHSDSNSMDQNIQIHPNTEGENEIYIPYWEEEGSSSTQLNHLMEEVRILKNKCKHLENHLEQNHRQFSSLNQLYLISQANERKLYKQNEELRKRHRETINQLSHYRSQLDSSIIELNTAGKRQADLRERLLNCNQRQTQLLGRLELLENQNNLLKRKGNPSPKNLTSDEDKWKKFYSEQITQIEGKWRAAYEELEHQFDKKAREYRQKSDELKNVNKTFTNMREEFQQKVKSLEGEVEDLKRQLNRSKGTVAETERQLKDLRQVLEDVSTKNDDIQRQNGKLKTKMTEQSNRSHKLIKQNNELQNSLKELNKQIKEMESQIQLLNKSLKEMRPKEALLQRANGQAKIEIQKLSMNSSYLQSLILNLREQLQSLKRKKQGQIQEIINNYQNKIQQINAAHEEDKSKLTHKIVVMQQQLTGLRKRIAQLNGQLQKNNNDNQDSEQLLRIRDQALRFKDEVTGWKNKLEVANRKIKDLEDQSFSNKDCGHSDQIKKLNSQLQKANALIDDLNRSIDIEKSNNLQFQSKLNENMNTLSNQRAQIQTALSSKHLIQQDYQNLKKQNSKLNGQLKKIKLQLDQLKRKLNQRIASQSDDRYRSLQMELRDKNQRIQQLQMQLQIKQRQRLRLADQNSSFKEGQKQKYRKLELKVIEKQKSVEEGRDKIDQLEGQIGDLQQKIKLQEREIKNKDGQVAKRDKKLKQNQRQIEHLTLQADNYQKQTEKLRLQIEMIKKQVKSDQNLMDKLKQQLIRNSEDQKQNIQRNNAVKQIDRISEQWQEKNKSYVTQIKRKDQIIAEMKRQITALKNQAQQIKRQFLNNQANLKQQINALELQIKHKNQIISKLQPVSSEQGSDGVISLSLSDLQAQYNRELLALKRLILYKGQREDQARRYQELKSDYQSKIHLFLIDYKAMQQQMLTLKEQVLAQPIASVPPPLIMPMVNVEQIQNVWRIRLQQICGQREILIEKVSLWQRRYQELKYLFEAKLQSKEETINLLNLKLNNLELSKQHAYSCACPFNYGHR